MEGHLEELKTELANGTAQLFDVREQDEWDMGHLTDATLVTLSSLNEGNVPEKDAEKKTYLLPPEHAAFLTRQASPNNIAVTTQWISVLGSVEDRIVECFKNGGGVDYEEYNRFHEVMADESNQTVVIPMLEHLVPLVPGLKEKLEKGIRVLDVGCGSGYALNHLAKHFPKLFIMK